MRSNSLASVPISSLRSRFRRVVRSSPAPIAIACRVTFASGANKVRSSTSSMKMSTTTKAPIVKPMAEVTVARVRHHRARLIHAQRHDGLAENVPEDAVHLLGIRGGHHLRALIAAGGF